jgi:hypothetical protein
VGGGTLILAAGLALGSAPVVSAAGAEVDLDVVTKVVTAYQDLVDSHWTDSNCSLSSCVNASSSVFASSGDKKSQRGSSFGGSSKKNRDEKKNSGENPKFTQAEALFLRVRDEMKDFGLPIKTAKSTIKVTDAKLDASGKAVVSVKIGTTKTYENNEDTPSYMVDNHTLTLAPNQGNLFAVVEDVINPVPQEKDPGNVQIPEGVTFDPVPLDRILGTETSGGNRPVANTSDAEFSLLQAHKDLDTVSTHPVQNVWTHPSKKQGKPDVQKMINYALYWTDEKVDDPNDDEDVINPAYPKLDSNCANFVSQVLEAGGWTRQVGQHHGSGDPYAWSPKSTDGRGQEPTNTWSLARALYAYAKIDSPYHNLEVSLAQPGDLIFVDWDPNGRADGVIDHAMVVTGKGKMRRLHAIDSPAIAYTPLISQKTKSRNNFPLFESVALAHKGDDRINVKDIKWYALTTR